MRNYLSICLALHNNLCRCSVMVLNFFFFGGGGGLKPSLAPLSRFQILYGLTQLALALAFPASKKEMGLSLCKLCCT